MSTPGWLLARSYLIRAKLRVGNGREQVSAIAASTSGATVLRAQTAMRQGQRHARQSGVPGRGRVTAVWPVTGVVVQTAKGSASGHLGRVRFASTMAVPGGS